MAAASSASSGGSGSATRNSKSSATKRIMQEHRELMADPAEEFVANPLEEDLHEWHVTVKGVNGTDYEGGIYHLKIVLPPEYPMKAPDITLLTPSGRFEVGKKICIDGLTSFHEGSWRPAWGVRTAIVGLMSFWNQGGEALASVGALNWSTEEKKRLAKLSPAWSCPTCEMSNMEIMDEHLNSFQMRSHHKPKDALADLVPLSPSTDARSPEAGAGTSAVRPNEQMTTHVDSDESQRPHAEVDTATTGTEQPANPAVLENPQPHSWAQTMLTPPPPSLAILRVIHYMLCFCLTPRSLRDHLPPRPSDLIIIDAAMHALVLLVAILLGTKVYRNFDKWLILSIARLQRVLGINLGVELPAPLPRPTSRDYGRFVGRLVKPLQNRPTPPNADSVAAVAGVARGSRAN